MSRSQRNDYLDKLTALIAAHGHAVVAVLGTPSHSYTVGLSASLGYELLLIGVNRESAKSMLNTLAAKLKEAPIADGEPVTEVATVALRLRTLPAEVVSPSVNVLHAMQPDVPLVVRQLLWPDQRGRFPGETGYAHPVSQHPGQLDDPPPVRH